MLIRLLTLAFLIPPLASQVERGFFVMNLFVSPLHASLNENDINLLTVFVWMGQKESVRNF